MKVRCTFALYYGLTKGKIYDVIKDGLTSYEIENDFGKICSYSYALFEVVTEELKDYSNTDKMTKKIWNDILDNVEHPSHYCRGGIECIDAIEASLGKDEFTGFLRGNIIKYVWRYKDKNGLEDLKKAQWYLNKLIEVVKNGNN